METLLIRYERYCTDERQNETTDVVKHQQNICQIVWRKVRNSALIFLPPCSTCTFLSFTPISAVYLSFYYHGLNGSNSKVIFLISRPSAFPNVDTVLHWSPDLQVAYSILLLDLSCCTFVAKPCFLIIWLLGIPILPFPMHLSYTREATPKGRCKLRKHYATISTVSKRSWRRRSLYA